MRRPDRAPTRSVCLQAAQRRLFSLPPSCAKAALPSGSQALAGARGPPGHRSPLACFASAQRWLGFRIHACRSVVALSEHGCADQRLCADRSRNPFASAPEKPLKTVELESAANDVVGWRFSTPLPPNEGSDGRDLVRMVDCGSAGPQSTILTRSRPIPNWNPTFSPASSGKTKPE